MFIQSCPLFLCRIPHHASMHWFASIHKTFLSILTVSVIPVPENMHVFDMSIFHSWVGVESLGTTPNAGYSGNGVVCSYFEVTVSIVHFHPQNSWLWLTEAVNTTINCNAVRLQLFIWIHMLQCIVTSVEVLRTSEMTCSTPSGSIALIFILIVYWQTTYLLQIARRCNHRYPWSQPLVAISDCTKESISWMSVCFFLLNKFSFLHNRCSVQMLIISPCWCTKDQGFLYG